MKAVELHTIMEAIHELEKLYVKKKGLESELSHADKVMESAEKFLVNHLEQGGQPQDKLEQSANESRKAHLEKMIKTHE